MPQPLPHVLLLSTISVVDANDDSLWTPLGILAIGTVLKDAGFAPILIDSQIMPDWKARVTANLKRDDLVFLGVSTLTGPSISYAVEAIELAQAHRPDLPVVWGGYHASLAKDAILRERLADYVVRGVGEPAIVPLAQVLHESGGSPIDRDTLRKIPNLTFVEAGEIVNTRDATQNIDDLPPLDYAPLDPTRYFTAGRRSISYISSYSCPWRCSYCAEPAHTLRRWRSSGPARVVEAITELHERYAPDYVDLVDPNFSSSPPRVVQVAEALIEAGNKQHLACNMRASDVVRIAELINLRRLKEAGFQRIFLGLESGSNRMLQGILQKDSTVEKSVRACQLLDGAEIEQFSSFIHDIPGETYEDSAETVKLARLLATLRFNRQFHHFFIPFPATDLYKMLAQESQFDDSALGVRDWAKANTYGGSRSLWTGRPEFRRKVLVELEALKQEFPDKFSFPQTIATIDGEE
jgi:radical SAM superfamily enzyme YgiQ (UPF0313 family)